MEVIKTLIGKRKETINKNCRKIINKVLLNYFFKGFLFRRKIWKITFKGKYMRPPIPWIFEVINYYRKLVISKFFKVLYSISSKLLSKNSRVVKFFQKNYFYYTSLYPDNFRFSCGVVNEDYLEYILNKVNLKIIDESDKTYKGKIIYTITKNAK